MKLKIVLQKQLKTEMALIQNLILVYMIVSKISLISVKIQKKHYIIYYKEL